MGVIDTITRGFEVINKRLWVLLVPILLDVFLWLGWRLSIDPVVNWMMKSGFWTDNSKALVGDIGHGFNLFSLLAVSVPSLMPFLDNKPTLWSGGGTVLEVAAPETFILFFLGLVLAGLLLGCIFLTPIAQSVRDGKISPALFVGRVGLYWLRLLGLLGVVALASLVVGLPFFIASFFGVMQGEGALLFLGFVEVAALWAMLFLYFAFDAILISEAGPLRAAYYSFSVVRRNFWSALAIVVLMLLIGQGTPLVWKMISVNPWGVLVGIVANAYIGTGLAAASMVFYLDRYTKWQTELKKVAA